MAAIKQLAAVTRSGIGKGAARSVRREGRVPGVIYGGGKKPEPISVDFKDLNKLIYSGHFLTSIFELEVDGRKERVLPRDYQLDVVTDRPLHVDFFRLTPGSRVRIGVPVHVVNREASPGVKKGGAVNLVLHTVEVMAPADAIPEVDHHRPRRSRLPQFGACLGTSSCPRAASRSAPRPTDGRDHRAADGHGRRGAAPPRPRPPHRRAPRPRPRPRQGRRSGQGRGPAKGAAAAPAKGAAPPPPSQPPRSKADKHALPLGAGERFGRFAAARPAASDRSGAPMLLIAGLGNPGARHARNRHNIGFMALEAIAGAHRFGPFRARFSGPRGGGVIGEARVIAAEAADLHEQVRPQRRRGAALPQARR